VFVSQNAMMRKARAAGFDHVEVLSWYETRILSSRLSLEVAPAQTVLGMMVNSYVLSAGTNPRVFFGGEARDLEAPRQYRVKRPSVDVVLAPIDGSQLICHKLVITNEGFAGDGDTLVKQATDSMQGFSLVLAGLKALLEHNVRLNLVADRYPKGIAEH
jgi:hypothetical protein